MTIAAATGCTEERACDKCGVTVLHPEHEALSCGPATTWWMPEKHAAPCGLPCISGGVKPAQIHGEGAHGYLDRCPRCGPLRVLPDMVDEMRERAVAAIAWLEADQPAVTEHEIRAAWCCGDSHLERAARNLLRCLDEICKLTTERNEARRLLSDAREQIMELEAELVRRDEAASRDLRGGR
jgi:hypothetical protein